MAFGVASLVREQTRDSDAALLSGVAAAGLMTGLGASLGYQANYSAAGLREVSIAPMVGEHNGLVVSGRF